MSDSPLEQQERQPMDVENGPPRELCYLIEGSDQLIVTPIEGSGITLSCDNLKCTKRDHLYHDAMAYYDNEENHLLCPECFVADDVSLKGPKENYLYVLTFH